MKKKTLSILEVKDSITDLKGKLIAIKIYKGRKKYLRCEGEIMEIHPSVFTMRLVGGGLDKNSENNGQAGGGSLISCSYNDIICGTVSLAAKKSQI